MTRPQVELLLLLLRASLVLVGALSATRLLRGAAARTRHRLWTLSLVALLLLPALSVLLPTLPLPIAGLPSAASTRIGDGSSAHTALPELPDTDRPASAESIETLPAGPGPSSIDPTADRETTGWWRRARRRAIDLVPYISLGVWVGGTILALAALLSSLLRTVLLARASTPVEEGPIRAAADALREELALRRPVRVLLSERVRTPMAGGVVRPTVFLPETARDWASDRLRVVLLHELIHIRHHDPHRNLLARIALAPYWFHPLAWIAARRAVIERERACDEAVVAIGTRPSSYARHLVELADSLPGRVPAPMAALSLIQRSLLERRVMSILDPTPRPACRRIAPVACLSLVLGTALVASAGPATPAAAAVPEVQSAAAGESAPVGIGAGQGSASAVVGQAAVSRAVVGSVLATRSASPAGQSELPSDSACWWSLDDGSHFSGTMSINDRQGILRQVGTRNGDRVVQVTMDGRQVCMRSEGDVTFHDDGTPDSLGSGRVLLETRTDDQVQSMVLSAAGSTFQVNGEQRPFDAVAEHWRDAMLAVVADHWQISSVRGQVSTLRGQISTLRGQRSTLRGQISTLRGEVSTMRGRASTVRGQESTMRGRISSIRGHVSTLNGAISSQRGAISSLEARRYGADAAERQRIEEKVAEHRAEIARLEDEIHEYDADAKIAEIEAQIEDFDANGKVAAIEEQIEDFDLDGKVAEIERRIDDLEVDRRTEEIERRIDALDADRRVDELQAGLEEHFEELERVVASIH